MGLCGKSSPLFNCQGPRHVTNGATRCPWQAGKGPILEVTSSRVKIASAVGDRLVLDRCLPVAPAPGSGTGVYMPHGGAW
jgi:hypothetical protein